MEQLAEVAHAALVSFLVRPEGYRGKGLAFSILLLMHFIFILLLQQEQKENQDLEVALIVSDDSKYADRFKRFVAALQSQEPKLEQRVSVHAASLAQFLRHSPCQVIAVYMYEFPTEPLDLDCVCLIALNLCPLVISRQNVA